MKKNSQNHNTVDYWDSLADGMVALFLCILLIVLLFVLYFAQTIRSEDYGVDEPGNDTASYEDYGLNLEQKHDDHRYDDPEPGKQQEQQIVQSGGGGGEGGEDGEEDEKRRREEEEEEEEEHSWLDSEEGEKSAVLVEVVDGETLLPLLHEGIAFELYDASMRLQTLNDYYPARMEHTRFETTEKGQFYLPEKIYKGNYLLRALTSVEGYDPAEDTPFSLDGYYDWEDPYYVIVKMFPFRSVIRIRLVDKLSGEGVAGGSFQVVAAANITTLDGSLRFRAGEIVDTIVLDANGYGESTELYLGKYFLRQLSVPEFYGALHEDVRTELKEKTASDETIETEKTAMMLIVRDALYDNITIPDAEFTVTANGMTQNVISDSAGQILLTNLYKNTTYRIRQIGAAEDYRMDSAEHSFTVDGRGLIHGAIRQEMNLENRMIRASFRVSGTLLKERMSDIRMVLTDPQGNIVHQWTTSGQDTLITGLEPGSYKLLIGSDLDDPVDIYISDEASVQTFYFTRWTLTDTAIAAGGGALLIVALVIVILVQRHRKRTRRGATK